MTAVALALSLPLTNGCLRRGGFFNAPSGYPPQGTLSDPMWQIQEDNAEPSKFVVYQHEWTLNTSRLNTFGEDHLKQIAARVNAGQNFAVIIERSDTSPRDVTEFKYPVHPSPELDMRRREVIVQALTLMGVPDAPQRVVVSMPITRGYYDFEAERSYYRSFNSGAGSGFGSGFGGFGAGTGGFGGGGFF
jgi:hypothetical protein